MHPVVLIAFILSGFSSLTLETVWIRYLEHVFGATTLAVSTVLTCFMGGLALGSWLFGRYADRLKSPVLAYGVAEGIVGLCAFVIPVIISSVYPHLNALMTAHLGNNFLLFSLVRFAAVAVLLIVPTTCMGATLPLLARYFMQKEGHMKQVGRRIGILYTLNTIGAITGVFAATFILLKTIGLWATNVTAGIINLCLFTLIFTFRKRLAQPPLEDRDDPDGDLDGLLDNAAPPPTPGRAAILLVMLSFFLSGLASMNLQVVWNRAMAMIIGSSVYSFGIVLIAFLVGLAAGSALLSARVRKFRNPVFALGVLQLCIAAAVMLSYLYIDDLPRVFARLVTGNVSDYEDHVGFIQFLMFIVAALPVFPATFCMGAAFPLTIQSISTSLSSIGRDVGNVYALNTLGAICGSFLSAFVFVPLFSRWTDGVGMQATCFLSISIYCAAGIAVMVSAPGRWQRLRWSFAAVAAVACIAFVTTVPAWDPARLTIGVFRLSLMKDALDEESWGEPDVKYYHDGVTTTVSIEMWGRHIALKNNGKVDASNGDDMPTQVMVAAVPLLLHKEGPEDLDVAIVGFGSGVTVGAALEFPVRHVDCVELEAAVIEASAVFGSEEGSVGHREFDVNHLVYRRKDSPDYNWRDPGTYIVNDRLSVVANDGRNFLATAAGRYDVIISEPSNPWITGVSNMFTRDSFAASAKALKPGGVFGQWVQLYEMSPENVKTILRTFADVYPHVALFSAEDLSSDTILVGSFSPIAFQFDRLNEIMADERIRREMNRAYVFSPTDLFARILLSDRSEVIAYTNGPDRDTWAGLPINTDDNAHIEFAAPRDLISFRRFQGYLATIYTWEWPFGRMMGKVSGLGEGASRAEHLAMMSTSLLMNGRKEEAKVFAKEALRISPDHPSARSATRMADLLTEAARDPGPAFADPETTTPTLRRLQRALSPVLQAIKKKAYRRALILFVAIPEEVRAAGGPVMSHLQGYLHFLNADPSDSTQCEEAITVLTGLLGEDEAYALSHPDIFYYLGLCHDNALHFDKAVKYTRRYVALMEEQAALEALAAEQARANLEAALQGISGTAPIPLPPDDPAAPTTDAAGESAKEPNVTPL